MKQKLDKQNLVTKTDLEQFEQRLGQKFATKLDLDDLESRIRQMFTEFSNKFFTLVDPLIKDLETRREDREIAANQMYEVREDLKKHEKRLTKLEYLKSTS